VLRTRFQIPNPCASPFLLFFENSWPRGERSPNCAFAGMAFGPREAKRMSCGRPGRCLSRDCRFTEASGVTAGTFPQMRSFGLMLMPTSRSTGYWLPRERAGRYNFKWRRCLGLRPAPRSVQWFPTISVRSKMPIVNNVDPKRVSLFQNASHSKNIGPMNALSSPAAEHGVVRWRPASV
jgi:hypothetical protein